MLQLPASHPKMTAGQPANMRNPPRFRGKADPENVIGDVADIVGVVALPSRADGRPWNNLSWGNERSRRGNRLRAASDRWWLWTAGRRIPPSTSAAALHGPPTEAAWPLTGLRHCLGRSAGRCCTCRGSDRAGAPILPAVRFGIGSSCQHCTGRYKGGRHGTLPRNRASDGGKQRHEKGLRKPRPYRHTRTRCRHTPLPGCNE
jgi:hypothetical protein